jgi:putative transposase
MGVARLSMFSDGTFYMPLNSFRQHEDWLCKVQQSITCKVKFSN